MNESLDTLSRALYAAKDKEKQAKDVRVQIEEQIAAQIETDDVGSRTVDAGNGLKITVRRANSYSADIDKIRCLNIPEEVMPIRVEPPQPERYVFDEKTYESIVKAHADVAAKLAPFVEVKPRKVAVSLKVS